MLSHLPPVTAPTDVRADIYLDGIRTRPITHAQTGEVAYWDVTYVGMRVPGCYQTSDHAYDAAIAWISDPDPWQRNFPDTVAASRRIPGLA